jgi:hypothetical protein
MVSKIEKARRYAEEKDRVRFGQFEVAFRGGHADHMVRYDHGVWQCDCNFFAQRKVCSHTMAMERILSGMLVEGDSGPSDPAQNAGRGTGGGTPFATGGEAPTGEHQSTEVTS